MFVRSDLLLQGAQSIRESHVISFGWDGFNPSMLAYDAKRNELEEIDLWNLALFVGRPSKCVGRFSGGLYLPCPHESHVSTFAQCRDCASEFIPNLSCIFEPKCSGEMCRARICLDEHVVYIAFHGKLAKVGMCLARRSEERAIEQGADAYCIVAKVKGRRTARVLEGRIADALGLRQTVRQSESLDAMLGGAPWGDIVPRYGQLCESLGEHFGLKPSPLVRLDKYPTPPRIEGIPSISDGTGLHEGRTIGMKGKYLVYQGNGLVALNLYSLVSRTVHTASARN